jgi:hypothetical protein
MAKSSDKQAEREAILVVLAPHGSKPIRALDGDAWLLALSPGLLSGVCTMMQGRAGAHRNPASALRIGVQRPATRRTAREASPRAIGCRSGAAAAAFREQRPASSTEERP